jgi:hypothetical protein
VVAAFITLHEFFQIKRHVSTLQVTAPAEFVRYVGRDILRPFL